MIRREAMEDSTGKTERLKVNKQLFWTDQVS